MTMRADQRPELLLNNDKLLKVLDLRSWEVLSLFLFRQTYMTERGGQVENAVCASAVFTAASKSPVSQCQCKGDARRSTERNFL